MASRRQVRELSHFHVSPLADPTLQKRIELLHELAICFAFPIIVTGLCRSFVYISESGLTRGKFILFKALAMQFLKSRDVHRRKLSQE